MQKSSVAATGLKILAAVAVPLFLTAPGRVTKRQKLPFMGRNFAHRGLHSRDRSVPENSLEAFQRAKDAGYGVELDVRLSKDGQVVVFHDDTLDRVCNVTSRVDELDYSELQTLRLYGSDYGIPLFSQVLRLLDGKVPVICEIKGGKNDRELCRKTYELLSEYPGDVCVESFVPTIVGWFRLHAPDLVRGQLSASTDNFKGTLSLLKAWSMSHLLLNFIGRPQFIAYKLERQTLPVRMNYLLGCMKVGWTSHEPRNEKGQDALIFEYYKPKPKFK